MVGIGQLAPHLRPSKQERYSVEQKLTLLGIVKTEESRSRGVRNTDEAYGDTQKLRAHRAGTESTTIGALANVTVH